MRRNIAKVSALIMAATTAMSPMMPAATTVAWADEVVAQPEADKPNFGEVDPASVEVDWSDVDWNAENVTVSAKYKLKGIAGEETVKLPVQFNFLDGQKHGDVIKAYVQVKIGDYVAADASVYDGTVPEGSTHYATYPHEYAKDMSEWGHYATVAPAATDGSKFYKIADDNYFVVDGQAPTCKKGSVKRTWIECEADHAELADSVKYEAVNKLDHTWSDWEVVTDDTVTLNPGKEDEKTIPAKDNVKLDKDEDKITVENESKDAYYYTRRTCTTCGEYQLEKHVIEAKANYVVFVAGTNTVVTGEIGKQTVALKDHSKAGTYTIKYYRGTVGNGVYIGSEPGTVAAGTHTWNETYTVDTKYEPTKKLFKDGVLEVSDQKDKDGNEVVINNGCVDVTVRYILECPVDHTEKADSEKLEVAKATVAHKNVTKTEGDAVAVDEKQHIITKYDECTVCGTKTEAKEVTENHTFATKDVVTKKATCNEAGNIDTITYCTVCGYEKEEVVHHPIAATGKHTYGDLVVEADGDYIISGAEAVTFTLHQYCKDCGHDNYEETKKVSAVTATVFSRSDLDDQIPFVKYVEQEDGFMDMQFVQLEDGSYVYAVTSKIQTSKYECAPSTISVKVVTSKSATEPKFDAIGKDDKVIAEFTLDYYKSEAAFYNRTKHVAGTPVTEEREDGTHKVTYCKYGCGTVMSDELVKPEEPEKTLGQVSGLKAEPYGVGSTKISWDALDGAEGYFIVGINERFNGQQIKWVTGTSYVDTDARTQDYNYYWVIPYNRNAEGKIVKGQITKNYVWAMGQTAVALNADPTENGVALTWDAVEGATKYIVKAKAASEKAATTLETVTGTSYVDATASADEYTFYWVIPVFDNAGREVVGTIASSNYVFGKTVE